ncbi:MAG: porin [Holosporales bacterium]|nr:porin [Holosporales bacterium]
MRDHFFRGEELASKQLNTRRIRRNIQTILQGGLPLFGGALLFIFETAYSEAPNQGQPVDIKVQKNEKKDDASDLFSNNKAVDIEPSVKLDSEKKAIVGEDGVNLKIRPVTLEPSKMVLRRKKEDVSPPNKLNPLWNHPGKGDRKPGEAPQAGNNLNKKQETSHHKEVSGKSTSPALSKFIKGQESASNIVVPTGSALFELRNVAGEEPSSKESEDIADVRLMQRLLKEKKDREEKARALKIAETKNVSRSRKESAKEAQSQFAENPNKLAHFAAELSVVNEMSKEQDPQEIPPKKPIGAKVVVEKVIYEEKDPNKPPYEIVECDIVEVGPPKKEGNFLASKSYSELPASVIITSDSPQMKFSGSMCSHIGAVMQDDARHGKDGDLHVGVGWADLSWEVSGTVAETLSCKYVANLQVVPGDVGVTDHYVQIECPFGTFQMGNVKGPDGTYADDATGLVGGTGGVDGSMYGLFSRPSGFPQTHHAIGYTKRATKIVYNSPRWVGFQAGLAYCPNPTHQGWGDLGEKNYSNSNDDGVEPVYEKKHNLAVGVNYAQDVKDFEVTASIIAINEQASQTANVQEIVNHEYEYSANIETEFTRNFKTKEDTSIHATGAVKYKNFKIAGGYISNGEQSIPLSKENADATGRFGSHLADAGRVWNIGGKYSFGCLDIGYARHKLKRRTTNSEFAKGVVHALSVDLTVASGVQVFAELDHIDQESDKSVSAYDGNENPRRNKGTVLLIGSKVSF